VQITGVNDVEIIFEGSSRTHDPLFVWSTQRITGSINRVTGAVDAVVWWEFDDPKEGKGDDLNYELQCRPTQRMF
jgi:hypothetical protein